MQIPELIDAPLHRFPCTTSSSSRAMMRCLFNSIRFGRSIPNQLNFAVEAVDDEGWKKRLLDAADAAPFAIL